MKPLKIAFRTAGDMGLGCFGYCASTAVPRIGESVAYRNRIHRVENVVWSVYEDRDPDERLDALVVLSKE